MALRIRCTHCTKFIPFSRGMLGTRITCPHCAKAFLVDSIPGEAGQAVAGPVAATSPAPAAAGKTPVIASVKRSAASAYDFAPESATSVSAPKAQPSKRSAPPVTDTVGYDLKPDPTPKAAAPKAAPSIQTATPAAAAPRATSKGLLARLWNRGNESSDDAV